MLIPFSKISSKWQVTIPRSVRRYLKINRAGEIVGFALSNDEVILKKMKILPEKNNRRKNG